MKKLLLFAVSALLACSDSIGQESQKTRIVVSLIENEIHYLNGGARAAMGGRSRVSIQIALPANTVEWMYTCRASKDVGSLRPITLGAQVLRLWEPTGTLSGLVSQLALSVASPGVVDVYLMGADEDNQNFLAKRGYNRFPRYSRENFQSGAIVVRDLTNGFGFIGLKNPSSFEAVSVALDVVAIVEE